MHRERKVTYLVIAILIASVCVCAFAEQIFTVEINPTPTPHPVYRESEELPYYRLDDKEVKILARLLWSSPLYSEPEKINLLWLVFNRVDADYQFGDSIKEVVNDKEFTFYDRKARISDKNKDIVIQEMTRWYAEKDGYHIGRRPPKNATYCRFVGKYNRYLELMSDPHGKAIEW